MADFHGVELSDDELEAITGGMLAGGSIKSFENVVLAMMNSGQSRDMVLKSLALGFPDSDLRTELIDRTFGSGGLTLR